jgi:peptide/nickel transport system permease protein
MTRRIATAVLMVFVVVTFTFFLIRLMPGNPTLIEYHLLLKQGDSPEAARSYVNALFGTNVRAPLMVQYGTYLVDLLHGNLGTSLLYPDTSVTSLVAAALPWTVFSVGLALLVSAASGVLLGTLAGFRRDGLMDRVVTPVATVLSGIPNYLTGTVFLFLFTVVLAWFPQSGAYGVGVVPGLNLPFLGSVLQHAALPVLSYAVTSFGGWYLLMKSSTVSTLGQEFIVGARARGLTGRQVVYQYVMPNSLLPLFTNFVLAIGFLFGGSVFVETIFSYPGLGYLLNQAVSNRDYSTMQGLFMLITVAVIASNLVADVLYVRLDPRIGEGDAL